MKKILLLFVFACLSITQINAQNSKSFEDDINTLLSLKGGTDFFQKGINSLQKDIKNDANFTAAKAELNASKTQIMSSAVEYVKATFSHSDVKAMISNFNSGNKLTQNSLDFSRRWRALRSNYDRKVKQVYKTYVQ
ncbi:DUF2059 domain-containing protein [Aureivirga marina]|uniref:hypothetical protein n=1 Tax=Aureivirga marina TaxID=1182451 RepID=UPI0018CBDB1A|nr:hypothetical protein [Aureivirga marina]